MDKQHHTDKLGIFGLATFNTLVLVMVGLGTVYWNGGVPSITRTTETGTRLGLFLYLWGTTWWTTKRAITGIDLSNGHRHTGTLLGRGFLWGGMNGCSFLVGLVFITELPTIEWTAFAQLLSAMPLIVLFGGIPAFPIGGIIGLILAMIVSCLVSINTVCRAPRTLKKDVLPCPL
jgi:hypothetical protein